MSFNEFIRSKGGHIKTAKREEAVYYLERYGTTYSALDYILFWYPERQSFWEAISNTTISEDISLPLKTRCRAVRTARKHWCRFLKLVYEPSVPLLPE